MNAIDLRRVKLKRSAAAAASDKVPHVRGLLLAANAPVCGLDGVVLCGFGRRLQGLGKAAVRERSPACLHLSLTTRPAIVGACVRSAGMTS